ncbi:MAG: S8 family serine peptidase [Saprospiraceae bacterium]|nr:S8 family serine peptidase [Saprospiraceae bacterium]
MALKNYEISPPSCDGATNGRIDITLTNVQGEISYSWSDGSEEGPTRTGLSTGTYYVTITDQSNGCFIDANFDLYPDEIGISPDFEAVYPDSSFSLPRTGGFIMGVSGGDSPYSVRVMNPVLNYDNTTNNIQDSEFVVGQLAAGEYTVIVGDANGCEGTKGVNIGYKRVIPPGLFILEYDDDITIDEYEALFTRLEEVENADLKKSCRCGNNGIEYLQLWEAIDTIELLTSGEASTTKTRPDTSGLSQQLIDPTWVVRQGSVTTPPCQGSAPSPKSANVAIIDSGSDLLSPRRTNGHEDLDKVYWTNRRTANGGSNIGCHTDDYEGYDFVGKKGQVHDSIGHGTHLSGILKYASPSNVDLNLMNLKVCSPDPSYAYSIFDLVCAIHYAVDSGAQVINLSLGYPSDVPSLPLYNALKRAEMEDIPVVVSAGNSSQDMSAPNAGMRWPVFFKKPHGNGEFKKLDNLLVVTSINDANNNLDSYANFGLGLVDIATVGDYFSTYSYYNSSGVYQQDWQAFKGTSQAAAYASSVIGAVKAHNPLIKTSDLFQQISRTHQPVAGLSAKLNTGGTLNAAALYRTLGLPITFTQGISAKTKLGWTPGWSEIDQVLPGANVKGILKHKGTRTILNNVMLIITARITGLGGVQEVDRIYYCATDIVDWTLPNPIPANVEQYFATVYIDGVKVEPTMPITPKR